MVDIDPLTGLPNRRSLRAVLRQAVNTGAMGIRPATIVFGVSRPRCARVSVRTITSRGMAATSFWP
jgi:superfamily II helicase